MATKARIVKIGNSRGIRVPQVLLDQAQLPDEVELHAEPGRLVVQAARRPRTGWAKAARAMHDRAGDALLDEPTATRYQEAWDVEAHIHNKPRPTTAPSRPAPTSKK